MKNILIILVMGLLWCNILPAKILNIENKMQIDVPLSHKYIKYDNEELRESIDELTESIEGIEINLYLVAPSKYVDLEKAILDGEDPMDNEYVQSIMKKLQKKNFQDEIKAGEWMISEAKKIMKKEKIDFITYIIIFNKTLNEMLVEGNEIDDIAIELQSMNNSELIKKTKKIKETISSLPNASKRSLAINENLTIDYNKLRIAKNEYSKLFLKGPSKLTFVMGPMKFDALLNVYIVTDNDKTYMLLSSCIVDCSKFNNKFDKMIKPIFLTNTQVEKKSVKISDTNNISEQLKILGELYKSGVLSKEEFTKAKKKILN
tara:strand:- start:351 stop:1304 length:954 start_codon:yes stop_codon:yes gene_type:complete